MIIGKRVGRLPRMDCYIKTEPAVMTGSVMIIKASVIFSLLSLEPCFVFLPRQRADYSCFLQSVEFVVAVVEVVVLAFDRSRLHKERYS